MSKVKIVIQAKQLESYQERGYALSGDSPDLVLGPMPYHLLAGLVVVECNEVRHERNNALLPRKYVLDLTDETIVGRAECVPYDVQEINEFKDAFVARATPGGGAECMRADRLHGTAREAAQAGKGEILSAINEHERAINRLRDFLKGMEVQ